MLTDLDPLMTARGIGAVIVPMHEAMHASFRWLTRGARVTKGYVVKAAGQQPFLVAYPMEREEAAATGIPVRSIHDFDHEGAFRQSADPVAGYARFFGRILREIGCDGKIAFYGTVPVHLYLGIAGALERDGWQMYDSRGEDIIRMARKRKDQREIEAIRSVGQRTELVVDAVRDLLRRWQPGMRIGDLKELIRQEIVRFGLVEDHETIVSHGRDAGIPHSRGNANQVIRPSVPIVLDIFPADRASGYFFDMTRTFCVGPVPPDLTRIHAHVTEAFDLAAAAMKPGTRAASYQALVCDYFEGLGYATTRTRAGTLDGYVHSLGHGVGLDIHEAPSFSLQETNHDLVEEGDIVTIEPGLYYPDREIGVRIEDTFVVTATGVEPLSVSRRDLQA